MSFEFTYRLTGAGWSTASISDGHASAALRASYVSDALGTLLEAIDLLLDGSPGSRCSWEEEPGESRWIFVRDGKALGLRVLQFDSVHPLKPDTDGSSVFETTQPLRTLAAAIANGAQAVLDKYGADGYLDRWILHPFPSQRLARIRAHLTTSQPTTTQSVAVRPNVSGA